MVLIVGNEAEYYFRINFSNYLKHITDKKTLIGILSLLFMTVGLVLTLNVAAGIYNRSERKRIQREKSLLDIPISEVELISIFEYLMRVMYNAVSGEPYGRWMSVKLRFRSGMMLLIVEGNTSQLNRRREDGRNIRLVREMTENHAGVLTQEKGKVQVFIPSTKTA